MRDVGGGRLASLKLCYRAGPPGLDKVLLPGFVIGKRSFAVSVCLDRQPQIAVKSLQIVSLWGLGQEQINC